MNFRHLVFVLATAGHATIAAAQAAEATNGNADEPAAHSGDIVVTAQKRSERLIDVPMSITAVSGEQLGNSGIRSTIDLQQVVPGLMTVSNGIGFVPSIRGVQSTGTSPGDEGNVAIYLDDVAIGSPLAGFFDLADIERIEVLKGPQGTLFGRNATGGAIRIITRKPSFTLEGNISLDYGLRYNDLRVGGFLTGPITDWAAASVSVALRKGPGFIYGIGPNEGQRYGGSDNYLVRGKLLFTPGEQFEAIIAADISSQKNDSAFAAGIADGGNPNPDDPASIPNGRWTFAGSTQPRIQSDSKGISADLTWSPGADISVRSITAYREVDLDSRADVDRTSLSQTSIAISQYQNSFSQELNVSGPSGGTFSWLVGAYYYNSTAGNPHFAFALGDTPGGFVVADFTNKVKSEALSGFGEVTVQPVENLFLTGGLRFNTESKDFHYRDLVSFGPIMVTDSHSRWNSTVYRAVARYDFASDANIYASISNGFKSGVYNAYTFLDSPVNPENIQAYEIGAKARISGITFTAAAFAYDYDDLQLSSYTNVNGVVVVTLANAASAKMRGLEFGAEGRITDELSIGTGISWQPTARYGDFPGAQVTVPVEGQYPVVAEVVVPYDATGSRMVRSPKTTANARVVYQTAVWGGDLNGTVNGYYNSGFYWQAGNYTRESSFFILNAQLSWTDTKRGMTYSVWGNNLTNSDYNVDRVPQTLAGDSISLPPRREFGLGVAFSF